MPQPNLIHPIPVTIEQIDRAATVVDPDAREPIQAAARKTAVVVQGQPKWVSQRTLEKEGFGPNDGVQGYVLFRYYDLVAAGITLDLNDRFTMQGTLTDEVYIVRLQPMGHYDDQGGATLVKAWFADRKPAKTR